MSSEHPPMNIHIPNSDYYNDNEEKLVLPHPISQNFIPDTSKHIVEGIKLWYLVHTPKYLLHFLHDILILRLRNQQSEIRILINPLNMQLRANL